MTKNGAQLAVVGAQLKTTEVRELPVEQLFVSLSEARKTMDQSALEELAGSIEKNGVIDALLVRPMRLAPWSLITDGGKLDGPGFEIVSGQRRFLASKLAGKTTCPCVVREMTDAEAAERRLITNLQREDLRPMEEAEGYGKLLERPGATIESIAAALGKSATYVGRRLKLLDAIEPVREALKCGAIEVGHALVIAPLSRKQQEKLLEYLDVGYASPDEEGDGDDGDEASGYAKGECIHCRLSEEEFEDNELAWADREQTVCDDPDCVRWAYRNGKLKGMIPTRKTVAELRSFVARTELRVLRDVPFPLDADLPPMACTACPKRAAGAASLFADVAEDTCTDPECLSAKLKVWVKYQLETADREGRKLVMLFDGHASDKAGVSRYNCVIGTDCVSAEMAIWAGGARIGHLVNICRDKKCPEHGDDAVDAAAASGTKGGVAKAAQKQTEEDKRRAAAEKAERAKLVEKVKKEREYRARLFAAIAQVPDSQIDTPRIQLLTKLACLRLLMNSGQYAAELAPTLGWKAEDLAYGQSEKLHDRVIGLSLPAALRAAALRLVVDQLPVHDYEVQKGVGPDRMEQIASWLGIDVKAVRAGKPQPSAPAAAPKSAAKKAAAKQPAKKAAKAPAKKAAPKKAAKKGGRK